MKHLNLYILLVILALAACTSPANQTPPKKEVSEREKLEDELASLNQMQKDTQKGITHVKKKNSNSDVIIKSYKLKSSEFLNLIVIKVQNKTPNDISFLQLSWKVFDKNWKELPKPGNQTGYDPEGIPAGGTQTLEWQIKGELPKYAKVKLDTVRMGKVSWDYD